nr:aminotransferase class I/II-fold pyridoxal phosphate-dependent enzyme [Rhodococcus sp. HNM0569]
MAGTDSGPGVPTPAPTTSASPNRRTRPRHDPTFADHPDVVATKRIYGSLDEVFGAAGLTNPFFHPHDGTNGATVSYSGRELINFGSFSYLGLAEDPRVREAAKDAIDVYGTSVSASRIVSGQIPLYSDLERRLADAYAVDDAVVTTSGYSTNTAAVGYLLGAGDLAVCDSLVHSSIVSGTRWAGCKRISFRHNDPDSLDAVLRMSRGSFERALVVLEGHYSMDGDVPPLPELIEVARRHDCSIMIDEAHSFGVLGRTGLGVRELFDLPGDAVDIWMGTLSKALGSCGGFLAGNADLVRGFKYSAPGVSLYATGPAPSAVAAARAAFDVMRAEPERVERVQANGALLHRTALEHGFDVGMSQGTPIVPILVRDTDRAALASTAMMERGVNTTAITHPSVPAGEERLRFFVSSDHTPDQIEYAMATLREVVDSL